MPGRTINNLSGGGARKRARRDSDEGSDQEEVVDVREASSGLRSENVRESAPLNSSFSPNGARTGLCCLYSLIP